MFMVLSSWQSRYESSPSSSVKRPLIQTNPNDLAMTSAVSPPVQAATVYIHHSHLLLLLNPKADTHFTVPRRVEG